MSDAVQATPQVKTYAMSLGIDDFQQYVFEMFRTTCQDGATLMYPEAYAMIKQNPGDNGMLSVFSFSPHRRMAYHRRVSVGGCPHGLPSEYQNIVEYGTLPVFPDGERKVFLPYGDIIEMHTWCRKLPKTGSIYLIWVTADGANGELCIKCNPKLSKTKEIEPLVLLMRYPENWVPQYNFNFNLGRDAAESMRKRKFLRTFGAFSMTLHILSWLTDMFGSFDGNTVTFVFFNQGKKCYAARRDIELWFEFPCACASPAKPDDVTVTL